MNMPNHDFELACQQHLNRFFASHGDVTLQKRAMKALRFIVTSENPLSGKPEGWAAGIIYAIANRDRRACGVPGQLNREFEAFFGVSMEGSGIVPLVALILSH